MPLSLRQGTDLRKRIDDRPPSRLVRDDVHSGRAVDLMLDQARNGDVVRGQPLGNVGENARAVVDLDVDVER